MKNPSVQDCGNGTSKLSVRCSPSDAQVMHELLAARVRLRVATVHARWRLFDSTVTAIGPSDVIERARQEASDWLDDHWLGMQW